MNAGFTIVKFRDAATRDLVLESGVVHFDRKPVILRPWSSDLETLRLVKSVLVWIRLPDLGLQYWGTKCLSALVSTIGRPMMIDKITKDRAMVKFARVLEDIEIAEKLPHTISFLNERGQLMEQVIEFEWLPTRCSTCKNLGHTASSCKKERISVWRAKAEKPDLVEMEDKNKQKDSDPVTDKLTKSSSATAASLITQPAQVKEPCCSIASPDSGWTTPKRVNGSKHVIVVSQPRKDNQYSVLKECQMEVTKQGQIANTISDGRRKSSVLEWAFRESKLRGPKIEEMMTTIFRGWEFLNVPAIEGRILLVWKGDIARVKFLWVEDQLLHCCVKIVGPWLVAGDFNAVFNFDDRVGGQPITKLEMEDARSWRASSLLSEIRRIGFHYTWSNKQVEGSRIFSKLDRVLSNEAWVDSFPNSEARFNWDTILDHCFCIIKTVISKVSGAKPFKFFNMWANHIDFRESVLNSWSVLVKGTGLMGILQKLTRLKAVLYRFNKLKVGDVIVQYEAAKVTFQ
ncbi:uncharacterized protein LOC133778976 [Humulus lupulus]|uniref:uncharacterized protein LOC133778976 n=1 Tax=Humulus lupulus TaxID=3486 RepID=UPI002B404562|nr:uncharacterized protein LOC133778976 [Humulus lupulus]